MEEAALRCGDVIPLPVAVVRLVGFAIPVLSDHVLALETTPMPLLAMGVQQTVVAGRLFALTLEEYVRRVLDKAIVLRAKHLLTLVTR